MKKICTKCKIEYPLTTEFWHKGNAKGGFTSRCKQCRRNIRQASYPKHREALLAHANQYNHTFIGKLREHFRNMLSRCTDPKHQAYKYYAAKGIQVKFISFQDFLNHITQDLNITTYEQIKGLEIHRVNDSLGYQLNNITFLTIPEHRKTHAKTA